LTALAALCKVVSYQLTDALHTRACDPTTMWRAGRPWSTGAQLTMPGKEVGWAVVAIPLSRRPFCFRPDEWAR